MSDQINERAEGVGKSSDSLGACSVLEAKSKSKSQPKYGLFRLAGWQPQCRVTLSLCSLGLDVFKWSIKDA